MRVIINAQVEWTFWSTLYPLFLEALPQIDQLSNDDRKDPTIPNAITIIRQNIRKIPLQLQQMQLNHDLMHTDFDSFLVALLSILDIFEGLIEEKGNEAIPDTQHSFTPQQELSLLSRYPKLTILKNRLQASELDLAQNIKFHGFKGRTPDYNFIVRELQAFNKLVGQLFRNSLEVSDSDLSNHELLRDDEVEFIRRAHHLNSLSRNLFALLPASITCCKTHAARIHLSGFLDPKISFELLINARVEQCWHVMNCKWVIKRPPERSHTVHNLCLMSEQSNNIARNLQLAFDNDGIWDDVDHGVLAELAPFPDPSLTLYELIFSGSRALSMPEFGEFEFEAEDYKIVELLLATSLLHLDSSHWLQAGWDMESILMCARPEAQDPLKRWGPYITCSLDSSPNNIRRENNDDILSFGILLLEMEAKRKVSATASDTDWVTGLPSKDSMLERVLTDWKRKLEIGYQRIGRACLEFRELVERFHHPALSQDMKRSAAIYKYILAPLHQLTTQRYCDASLLSRGFPEPPRNSLAPKHSLVSRTGSPGLILFDDSNPNFIWHDPLKVKWASEFINNIKSFVDKIRDLADCCKPIPDWATWRQDRIRIAIIDTGIDDDDIMIESALDYGRIKACRGFLNDKDDHKDINGHGTHVVRLLLEMAPSAELYIAKISDSKQINSSDLSRISKAIEWAREICNVHIISMSFGIETRDVEIHKAISKTSSCNIAMFAAAANNGGNKPRAYPSNTRNVVCVHASDGRGNDGQISPSPLKRGDNFSTLGISIESKWKGSKVYISGTSFATPVAVALAANVLEFARNKCSLSEFEQESLYSFGGISEILRLMSTERHNYDYINPLHLWNGEDTDVDIARKITGIARSI